MKKSKFGPGQIAGISKEFEGGKSSEEVPREHGVSMAGLYQWEQQYGSMAV